VTFGHAVKNGALPPTAAGETTVFEHNCSTAPCMITQLHVPSIYPHNTADWDWQDGRLKIYVDGEHEASIAITLLELAWVSAWASPPHSSHRPGASGGQWDNRGLPWQVLQFGHTATSGGVSSTLRIPFGSSIRVTLQAPGNTTSPSVYWMIVRGVESGVVTVGDFELPPTARMRVYRVNTTLDHLELVTLAEAPANRSGAIIGTKFDAAGSSYSYLEACMRLYPTGDATSPLFLSSGAEDYFLSASYFDEGEFVSPNSGLTFKDNRGGAGAYKMHDLRDPVLWHTGFKLQFRSGESTEGCGSEQLCPNQWCPRGGSAADPGPAAVAAEVAALLDRRASAMAMPARAAPPDLSPGRGNDSCVPGPIAYGFDRPGGDGEISPMRTASGKWCSGAAMVNASGCSPADCADVCCQIDNCTAWVHGIASGCDKVNDDPNAVCCWTKVRATQLTVKRDQDLLSTGEVAGHTGGTAPPTPPNPGPVPWDPPYAPLPQDGKTLYSTLVYTYEWPAGDTPAGAGTDASASKPPRRPPSPLADRLAEVDALKAANLISAREHRAARNAVLGISD